MVTRYDNRLAQLRAAAHRAIDAAAGAARARHITVSPGQEVVYLLKAAHAEAYRAAGYPADAAAWPLVALEARALAQTPRAIADQVLALRDAWALKAAQIEAARLVAKRAVDRAASAADLQALRDAALRQLATD